MNIYVCGGKQTQGNVTQYFLRDVKNNKELVVQGDELKEAMRKRRVDVMNLTLTSDNRLVEASKDKIAKLDGLLKAPAELRDFLDPLDNRYFNDVEDITDEIIRESIEKYAKDCGKYIRISNINKENNTFVLEFTLGLNSYVLCHYEKLIYGQLTKKTGYSPRYAYRDDFGAICFDIGIQVVAISNKRASSKIGSGEVFKASKSIHPDEYYSGESIRLNFNTDDNGKLTWADNDIEKLKKHLGKFIIQSVATELVSVCENNPDIANNTNVEAYIKYDNSKKQYAKDLGLVVGATIGCSVVLSCILAFSMATNPELIQTGLLAKIAQVGTTEQIIRAIATYSIGGGTIVGSGATVGTFASKGLYSMMKKDKQELKEQKNNKRKDWMGILGK